MDWVVYGTMARKFNDCDDTSNNISESVRNAIIQDGEIVEEIPVNRRDQIIQLSANQKSKATQLFNNEITDVKLIKKHTHTNKYGEGITLCPGVHLHNNKEEILYVTSLFSCVDGVFIEGDLYQPSRDCESGLFKCNISEVTKGVLMKASDVEDGVVVALEDVIIWFISMKPALHFSWMEEHMNQI